MTKSSLTPREFAELLDRHGADERRWPADARAAMLDLARDDPEAERLWRQARALEELLAATAPDPVPESALEARILTRARVEARRPPATSRRQRAANDDMPRRRLAVAMLAASLLLGFSAGMSGVLDGVWSRQVDVLDELVELASPARLAALDDLQGELP